MKEYYVYIMTNSLKTVLYTGVTGELTTRVAQHKSNDYGASAFTARYAVHYLVHYEIFGDINDAIAREKQIKGLTRAKKEQLISATNPSWRFLCEGMFDI